MNLRSLSISFCRRQYASSLKTWTTCPWLLSELLCSMVRWKICAVRTLPAKDECSSVSRSWSPRKLVCSSLPYAYASSEAGRRVFIYTLISRISNSGLMELTLWSFIKAGHPVVAQTKRSKQNMVHHVRRRSSSSIQSVPIFPSGRILSTWCKFNICAALKAEDRVMEAFANIVCSASKQDISAQACTWPNERELVPRPYTFS